MGRGLSQLQRSLLTQLELAQYGSAQHWAAESVSRWERLAGYADSARRDALSAIQHWGGPLDQLCRGLGGLRQQPGRVLDAQRGWDRAESYAAEYLAGPAVLRPEHGYATYGSLLHLLHPELPLLASAASDLARTYGSDWDLHQRRYQRSGHTCASCPERESRQAAMRRALIRLGERGLILRRDGRAWLPDLLPGALEMSTPSLPDGLGESAWDRVERERMAAHDGRRERLQAAARERAASGMSVAEQLLAQARARSADRS